MNRTSDVLIIGGGIIGVSLALELRRGGASVRVLERGEPGKEASHAGAGMLSAVGPETPKCLRDLAAASAEMYPLWVAELEAESGRKIDYRQEGTIYFAGKKEEGCGKELSSNELRVLEPGVTEHGNFAYFIGEASVDPRDLMSAAVTAAKKLGVVISHQHKVAGIELHDGRVTGVRVGHEVFAAGVVVNCAGAWAGEVEGCVIPSHPVKGQMLSVVSPHGGKPVITHVLKNDDVYLVPRSDGRILIGATVEDAGFDKTVNPDVILKMRKLAEGLIPGIGEMRIHESWAGLRPGSPDKLPLLGETTIKGYFAGAGHYRNGILLAPITAKVMAKMVLSENPGFDLNAFDPKRFA